MVLILLTAVLTTCALAAPVEPAVIYVSQTGDGDGSTAKSPTTLEGAVNKANDGDTIIILDNITVSTVISLDKSVTIKGEGEVKPTLTAGDKQMFSLGSDVSVTFENLAFDGSNGNYSNSGTFYGGAISADGRTTSMECENVTLTVIGCEFKDFEAYHGGAICFSSVNSGSIYIRNSVFTGNKANVSGGAVGVTDCEDIDLTADGSKFENNTCGAVGGAIGLNGSSGKENVWNFTITDCDFRQNKASGSLGGGALGLKESMSADLIIEISQCDFTGNETLNTSCGGALYVLSGDYDLNIETCNFVGNKSAKYGGAVYLCVQSPYQGTSYFGNAAIEKTKFEKNSASQGGALYLANGCIKTNFNKALFDSNTAGSYGNAIFYFPSGYAPTVSWINPTDGAAFVNNGGTLETKSTIYLTGSNSGSDDMVHICDYMLDGTRLVWKTDDVDEEGNPVLVPVDREIYSNFDLNLYAGGLYLDADTKAPSYSYDDYSVLFISNSATLYGGAICNYGSLMIGSPGKNIEVSKVWDDELDTHEAVTVNLVRESDKAELDELTLGPDSWSGTFYGFPTNIVYSVTEDPVEGYTAQITNTENGVTITNTSSVSVAIVPADITVYVGGSGYVGAVDGDGEELGETSGFPTPGFVITAEGIEDFDPAQAVLTFQSGGISRSWRIVPYDGVEGASHGVYRFVPTEGSSTAVKMQFFDEATGQYVDSDSFDIESSLCKDLAMKVYGEGILLDYVKLEYGGKTYSITTDSGTLKVRSTTSEEDYGSVVARAGEVPRGEPGVVAPEGTTYYINNKGIKVTDDSGVKLLFDDIIEQNNASVSNTQLLINRADKELGGGVATRRYEAKYLDLVDTDNGNAWVAADGTVTVYWPLPAGTGWNTNFTLLRFDGLNRETSVGKVENLIATCNVTPIRVENTGTHIKFTVEKAGFAPFILVWDEYNTPITPIPEPDNSPVGLNTEDHVAYIIGYEDGTVRPGANITRAEVATIFFRLLTDETRESYWSQSSGFTDVASGAWYNNAVSTLTRAGILDGYEDGSFRPNASITRAEFTKIAVSFFKHVGGASSNPFNDVPDSAWYAEFVKAAAELGLIDGYEDGTFRPNAPITRAEACTIVNRTLGRAPDKDNLLPEHEMLTWPDNSRDAWYYAQIQEATNSHDYQWLGAIELWTAKLAERDWDALEKEWSNAYSAPGGDVVR